MKSCYILEISVSPGGARKAHAFISNNLDEIKTALETDIKIDLMVGIGLLYCYKEEITLRTIIQGEEQQRLNLLPYITIHGEDGTSFKLDENAHPIGVLKEKVFHEEFLMGASAEIDWSSMPIMELTGDLLQRAEVIETVMLYRGEYTGMYQYGYSDLEFGISEEDYLQEISDFFQQTFNSRIE